MADLTVKEPYTDILAHLGDVQQQVNEAVRQHAMQQAQRQILDLKSHIQEWESKYGCTHDPFAYRVATDDNFVHKLNGNAQTQEWESDLLTWEFYATELKEWRRRLTTLTE